jgi:hypothetical protein
MGSGKHLSTWLELTDTVSSGRRDWLLLVAISHQAECSRFCGKFVARENPELGKSP